MIILGIIKYALVFIVVADTGWFSSIIICFGSVCVIVVFWSSYTKRYSSTNAGEVSACIGCRWGERLLGHCFSVCLIFLFLHGWEYHVSAAKPPIISAWFCSFTSLSTTAYHIPVHQILYLWNILPSLNIIIPCIISIIYTPHHQCLVLFIYFPLLHSRGTVIVGV